MLTHIDQFIHTVIFHGKWYLICLAIFIPLAFISPSKRSQPLLRRDMTTDTLYWFFNAIFQNAAYKFILILLLTSLYSFNTIELLFINGNAPIANFPLWIQVLMLLLITDFLQYWMHRIFHTKLIWKFHAIHHSSKHVDWLSAARFHPINFLVYITFINAIVFSVGFNPAVYMLLLPFNMIYPSFVHSNLNWTLGPFRYFLASPVFHRWHHTSLEEGGNKNFAPTFPFLDILFGTYYEPKKIWPSKFGVEDDAIPEGVIGQFLYPFRRN